MRDSMLISRQIARYHHMAQDSTAGEISTELYVNFVYFELCIILLAVIAEYYGCEV